MKCQNVDGKKNITVPVTFFGLFFDVFRKAQKQKNTRDAGKSAQTNKTKKILAPSHLIRALLKSSSNSVKDLAASTKTQGLLQKHQVF